LNIESAKDKYELAIDIAQDEVKYNNKILGANMQSAINQMGRNIQQIEMQKMQADMQAEANRNLFPEELDYAPEPQMQPRRRFVEPEELDVPIIPKGPRVATGFEAVAPVVLNAASFAMGIPGVSKAIGSGLGSFGKMLGIGNTGSQIGKPGTVFGQTFGRGSSIFGA